MHATLEAAAFGSELRIECFRGKEELCRPYRFDIQFSVLGGDAVELADAVGATAALTLKRDDDRPHVVHGIIASARLLVHAGKWALYEATLVPRVWSLGLTRHSNVFTKSSVPDIIQKVLESAGYSGSDFELRLTGDYEEEQLVVQYRESKLDFLHRWMEHEGMYYFFEHADGAEKMVIVDDASAHGKMVDKTIRYRPTPGEDSSAGECFDIFTLHHNITVKSVKLSDYDYARPALDVSATEEVSANGMGEMSLHGSRFFDPAVAQRYAKLRSEELKARQATQHASGTAMHVGAGYHVELAEHPVDKLNDTYLVTAVTHFCNQMPNERAAELAAYLRPDSNERYRVECATLNNALRYRPPLATQRPRVWGYENGIVDGEADSPYAQLDDQGRYLVKFQFDESDLDKGKASTFVRMMQPHGGGTEGFHFPLRKETEVIFSFLGGDPDRPVITGVVPNAVTPSPVTKSNHTQNVIRTGGNNHLIFNDDKDKEFISLRTPKDNSALYLGNPIGAAMESFDGAERRWEETPAGSIQLITDGDTDFNLGGLWWVNCNSIDETAFGTVKETYMGHHSTKVTSGGRREEVVGLMDEDYQSSHQVKVTGTRDDTVTAALTETYSGGQATTVSGGERVITAASGERHEVTNHFNVTASGTMALNAPFISTSAATTVSVKAGANVTIKAPSVVIDSPNFEQNDGSGFWRFASFSWAGSKKGEAVGVATGFTGAKFEMALFSLSINPTSIGWKGLALENKGINVAKNGPEGKLAAIRSQVASLYTFV